MTGQEKVVEIKLNQKRISKDIIIKELCNKINLLDKENKDLKEEINIIREELYEIKKWKNEKEEEINKLCKSKKEKIALEVLDSKILTKLDELEFIEKIFKNNDEILMNKIFRLKLLYRTSRDGDSSASFLNKYDNIRGTLTFVKTKTGLIFGGYTGETSNESSCCYKTDSKAFCFSIDLRKKNIKAKKIYIVFILIKIKGLALVMLYSG